MNQIQQAIKLLTEARNEAQKMADDKFYRDSLRDASKAEADFLRDVIDTLADEYKLKVCDCGEVYARANKYQVSCFECDKKHESVRQTMKAA